MGPVRNFFNDKNEAQPLYEPHKDPKSKDSAIFSRLGNSRRESVVDGEAYVVMTVTEVQIAATLILKIDGREMTRRGISQFPLQKEQYHRENIYTEGVVG